jgi:Flp pilus assembly protein TadG
MQHPATLRRRAPRIVAEQSGATIVEFAIVASVFFMLIFAVIEYGLIQFTRVAIESATAQVSRTSSIGGGTVAGCSDRVCEVKQLIEQKTRGLIGSESVYVTSTVVGSPNSDKPPIPDICIDPPGNPYPASADQCQAHVNNGGGPGYDPPAALTGGALGAAGDMVEIRATYLWRVLFPPFRAFFGDNGVLTITSSTVVKNEPF